MKKALFLIPVVILVIWSCQKEPAKQPSAKFTTNLVNNTIVKQTKFMLYLDQTEGEFITYFKGDTPKKTYNKDDFTISGSPIIDVKDSLEMASYGVAGEYTFTVLAISYGNWGGEQLEAVDSIRITVTAN
jgi:hypothetical protein